MVLVVAFTSVTTDVIEVFRRFIKWMFTPIPYFALIWSFWPYCHKKLTPCRQ